MSLPQQLKELYLQSNGISGSGTVTVFAVEALYERNETYETIAYLPKFIYLGNDNGDCGVFVAKSADLSVYECDLGAQSDECLKVVAPSLSDWFASRCPWSSGALGAPARGEA